MAPTATHDRRDAAPRHRRGYRWVPTLHHRARHAPNPRHTDVVSWLIGIGMGMTLALGVRAESWADLTKPGGIATFGGRLSALAGTYLMLVVVLLISRLPAIERSMGHDKLVRWHRKLAPIALCLIVAHGLLITLGYAQGASRGVLHEFWVILTTVPGMLMATAGFALFMAAGLTSYRIARRRLTHEAWWLVHLTTYLAISLSFFHQIWTRAPSFVSTPSPAGKPPNPLTGGPRYPPPPATPAPSPADHRIPTRSARTPPRTRRPPRRSRPAEASLPDPRSARPRRSPPAAHTSPPVRSRRAASASRS
jgi:DMSO/TMAO reductase YedYZ heme-binding membrane subunit